MAAREIGVGRRVELGLLGFRFAPRIRDLADKRLYVPGPVSQWPALTPLIGASLNAKLIEQQLGEVLRLRLNAAKGRE